MLTRRCALTLSAALPAAVRTAGAAPWSAEWNRAILLGAVASMSETYDAAERMGTRKLGPQYQYHTNLRSLTAHPTRDSLNYALYLLEAGDGERAAEILDRVLALQDTAPDSKWYGLWGWYLEEPPSRMSPADWNWADFNGGTLIMLERRHGAKLPPALRERVREAIRHAAYSVRRRNVRMSYTNIAVKGTFVTLAAAELLELEDLREYATERMHRLAQHIDETGSFDEYNSPTYARVTIANLTRMRMTFRSAEMKSIAGKIHQRAWLHLAKHWHAPTRQLAGPMSRCYRNDIGHPLWLQKALGGRLELASLDEVRTSKIQESGETAVLDFDCPNELAGNFLRLGEPRQHREIFKNAEQPEPPLQGTTYLSENFSLGSANKSDFWVQRRPLLGYWVQRRPRPGYGRGDAAPAWLQLRLIKDDYDFSSGLFYSVQEKGSALGFLNFRSPGGDRHIGLDPVTDGAFECSRLRWRIDLEGVPENAALLVDGKPPASLTGLPPASRLAIDLGGVHLWLRFQRSVFGESKPALSIERNGARMTVSLDLHRSEQPETLRWADVKQAWAVFAIAMEEAEGSLADFSLRCAHGRFEHRPLASAERVIWQSPAGRLWLDGGSKIATLKKQHRAYRAGIRSGPVPYERLSEERLAP